jgi:hypothetical protein
MKKEESKIKEEIVKAAPFATAEALGQPFWDEVEARAKIRADLIKPRATVNPR